MAQEDFPPDFDLDFHYHFLLTLPRLQHRHIHLPIQTLWTIQQWNQHPNSMPYLLQISHLCLCDSSSQLDQTF